MNPAIKVALVFLGAVLGFFVAVFGTYYGCVLLDQIMGNAPGSGYVTIGFIFWLITVPMGTIIGGGTGLLIAIIVDRRRKRASLSAQ